MTNWGKLIGKINGQSVYRTIVRGNHDTVALGKKFADGASYRSFYTYVKDGKPVKTCERFTTDYSALSSKRRLRAIANSDGLGRQGALNQVSHHNTGATTRFTNLQNGNQTEYIVNNNFFQQTQLNGNRMDRLRLMHDGNGGISFVDYANASTNALSWNPVPHNVNQPFVDVSSTLRTLGLA